MTLPVCCETPMSPGGLAFDVTVNCPPGDPTRYRCEVKCWWSGIPCRKQAMTGAVHRDVAPGFRAHRDFEVAAGPQLMENHLAVGIVPETCCR